MVDLTDKEVFEIIETLKDVISMQNYMAELFEKDLDTKDYGAKFRNRATSLRKIITKLGV